VKRKVPKIPTLSERIDEYLRTVPRSRPWYDTKNRCWKPGHAYITKRAVFAIFQARRRDRTRLAMAELDAEIAAEAAAERRRLAKHKASHVRKPRCARGGLKPRP
jgi:hypothetical protein